MYGNQHLFRPKFILMCILGPSWTRKEECCSFSFSVCFVTHRIHEPCVHIVLLFYFEQKKQVKAKDQNQSVMLTLKNLASRLLTSITSLHPITEKYIFVQQWQHGVRILEKKQRTAEVQELVLFIFVPSPASLPEQCISCTHVQLHMSRCRAIEEKYCTLLIHNAERIMVIAL